MFIVWQPSAFTGEAALVGSTSLDAWKDWLAYHLIETYADVLPKAIADEDFAFEGPVLSGTLQQRPRWQRGVAVVNGELGDAVGKIYAQRYFPAKDKADAEALVAHIIADYRERLRTLSWMAPATKTEAIAKLNALYVGIGYPESWRDYSGYEVQARMTSPATFAAAELFYYHFNVARIGKPVNRKEWSMTPQTVNAVNLPLQNALNFPAAILQPPFFDPAAPNAANYGAIGSVIGHEISHTFDTRGQRVRRRRAHAQLVDGLGLRALSRLDGQTRRSVRHLQTISGPFRKRQADAGGGHRRYCRHLCGLRRIPILAERQSAPVVHGFTGDQQFFIAFGQNYASKTRPAALREQVLNDSHAPAEYRADTVRNVDAWYKAFDVKPGQGTVSRPAGSGEDLVRTRPKG